MQHFKLVISNRASLSGNSLPIFVRHGLAASKSGLSSLNNMHQKISGAVAVLKDETSCRRYWIAFIDIFYLCHISNVASLILYAA